MYTYDQRPKDSCENTLRKSIFWTQKVTQELDGLGLGKITSRKNLKINNFLTFSVSSFVFKKVIFLIFICKNITMLEELQIL